MTTLQSIFLLISYILFAFLVFLIVKIDEINNSNFRIYVKKYIMNQNDELNEAEKEIQIQRIKQSNIFELKRRYFSIFIHFSSITNPFKNAKTGELEVDDFEIISKNKRKKILLTSISTDTLVSAIVLMSFAYQD